MRGKPVVLDLSFQDTVSVHRPSFYADRFLKFMNSRVFKKIQGKIFMNFFFFLPLALTDWLHFVRFLLKEFELFISPKQQSVIIVKYLAATAAKSL